MTEKNPSKHPGRPPRLSRVFDQSPLYFVTFNTWKRRSLLPNEKVHESFRGYAEKNLCRGFAVGRYVIMPDHIHLFVRIGVERSHWQVIWLLSRPEKGYSCQDVADLMGFSGDWVRKLVRRYNNDPARGLKDKRQDNGGGYGILAVSAAAMPCRGAGSGLSRLRSSRSRRRGRPKHS